MLAENRVCHSLSSVTEKAVPARNMAELLCDLGLVLRWRMQSGAGMGRAPLLLQSLRWDSQLALRFVNLKASVQLRAMVEDWPVHRIQESVQEQRRETPGRPAGHPTSRAPRV
jgi:hypothetical protein